MGAIIFSHFSPFFLVFKILNFNIFGSFQKNEHFGRMKILGVITKLAYILGSFLCILGSCLKVQVQNGGYFLGLLKFQFFGRVLEIPDIFWG